MSHLARRITNLFFAFVLTVMSVNLSGVLTLNAAQAKTIFDTPTDGKITICHRTDSVTNPYVQITVDTSAADGLGGKGDHYSEHQGPVASSQAVAQNLKNNHIKWGDIIPPVVPGSNVPGANTAGLNWTAAGQAVYYNGCAYPVADAAANVTVTNPTCDSASVASVSGVAHATLTSNGGILDQTVGTHTATFTAVVGHLFANNAGTLTVTYTIVARLTGEQCVVKDATASVTPTPATCEANGSANYTVNHATLNGVLDKTPGTHMATFTADAGHAFANGQTMMTVTYTVPSMLMGEQCAGPKPSDDKETRVVTGEPVCSPNGGGTVTSWTEQRTRTYILVGSTWVAGPWSSWTKVPESETTRAATDKECPRPCTPVDEDAFMAPLTFNTDHRTHHHHHHDDDDNHCPTPPTAVVPTEPTIVDNCGTTTDSYTIPAIAGVQYYVNGALTPAGTYKTNGALSVAITTKATQGYTFGDHTYSWTLTFTDTACQPQPCTPSVVSALVLTQVATDDTCTPGMGGGGTPSTPPQTPVTPTKTTTPVVTELPQTGPAEGNPIVKIATIIVAGIVTYGAMFSIVNRRELLRK